VTRTDPSTQGLRRSLARLPESGRRRLRCLQPGSGPASFCEGTGPEGRDLLDLASNDYLGLSRHPQLQEAATRAMAREGVGAGASRLVSGTRPSHRRLESRLARWLDREAVLLFPSGYQANVAAVTALTGRHGWVVADRLAHHSLLAGIRCSGARLRRFAHNDLADLDRQLQRCLREGAAASAPPPLVVSESLFSMEGTSPDLQAMARLCADRGARLLVDEAHAIGVLGRGGRGLCHDLAEPVTLISGTLGKAFGSGGAFLAGDATLGEWLLQTCGAFRYSTALAPPLAAAADAALQLIETHPEWGRQLRHRARRWRREITAAGWARPPGEGPVLPLLTGTDEAALRLQRSLEAAGLLCVAIRPPTVPQGGTRLRLVLRRDLPDEALERLLGVLRREAP
jgi:8-amino-7-oxononanoate synthase